MVTVTRTQTIVQLTPELLAALDQHAVSAGKSRSEVIRDAVERYLQALVEAEIDRRIVDGYTRVPQEPDSWADNFARESVAEPW